MSRFRQTMPQDYFEDLYVERADPWAFATSAYERDKYDATLEALPRASYARALEIGCSIGVLTERLAVRCTSLIALDPSSTALDAALARCADRPHVTFLRGAVPDDWPDGTFDLILLSEMVYYLDAGDVDRLAAHVARSILPQGDILLVHWLGETNYPLGGDEASDRFIEALRGRATIRRQTRDERYRLDLLRA